MPREVSVASEPRPTAFEPSLDSSSAAGRSSWGSNLPPRPLAETGTPGGAALAIDEVA
jgi:hypothetical protein